MKLRISKIFSQLVCLALLGTTASTAVAGMPYCALRDPAQQIYKLFPEAQSYKSEVHTVDATVRDQVANELPFTLHERELGRHTIYVPVVEGQGAGVLHVRSEASEWGLVEVAWALDASLQVIDFNLQRCRGASCKQVDSEAFKNRLRGLGATELAALLDSDQQHLAEPLVGLDGDGLVLAATVIRSGMKTIAVTSHLQTEGG